MKKIKKNNIATKNDIQKLDKKLGVLEKKLNGEIREVKNELALTRFKLGTEIDKSKIEILEKMEEFRSDIFNKVDSLEEKVFLKKT